MASASARIEVSPALLAWARQRSGRPAQVLEHRFPRLADWESGSVRPTLRQLEAFAAATRTPVGYLFLPEPPRIELPLPDLRGRADEERREPSPDLLDTLSQAQRRQRWYREYARASDAEPVAFVGSLTTAAGVDQAAARIREALTGSAGLAPGLAGVRERGLGAAGKAAPGGERGAAPGVGGDTGQWAGRLAEAFRRIVDRTEELGVLVMVSGVAGANTRRRLDASEFGGFALADRYAPVVFVNGAAAKGAQIFTLVHELAHLALGQSALDRPEPGQIGGEAGQEAEGWCSDVAAETLFPLSDFKERYQPATVLTAELDRLAWDYRVPALLVLRRCYEAGLMDADRYREAYRAELARSRPRAGPASRGGNFYYAQPARTSKRFARAIIASALEGQTRYRDALALLGFSKESALDELATRLGAA